MFKVVVDTNVLVSALISPYSYPREVERRWRKKEFILVTSREIIHEVTQVLYMPRIQHKYHLSEHNIQTYVLALLRYAECVAGIITVSGVAHDPGDDKLLACATEGKADFIVTGDKALQALGYYRDIKIISPEAFVKALNSL